MTAPKEKGMLAFEQLKLGSDVVDNPLPLADGRLHYGPLIGVSSNLPDNGSDADPKRSQSSFTA